MAKKSAGLLMYRTRRGLEVLLVHLGGPFWAKKDKGAWFLPKGEVSPGEDELAAAQREFKEETGLTPGGSFLPLSAVKHKSGKTVVAWAFEGDCDPAVLKSNTFTLEGLPGRRRGEPGRSGRSPRSGKKQEFPEVDRAAFFTPQAARERMHPEEFEFILRLESHLAGKSTHLR